MTLSELVDGHIFGTITVLDDGGIFVDGDVDFGHSNITHIPFSFTEVTGNFDCSNNYLQELYGCPHTVGGWFDCKSNYLKTLDGSPKLVGDGFYCYDNELTTLYGGPHTVGGSFYCHHNNLTSIRDCPTTMSGFYAQNNNLLKLSDNFYKTNLPPNRALFDSDITTLPEYQKWIKIAGL